MAGSGIAFLNLGFRPFFAGAGIFAVLSMLAWMAVYVFAWQPGTVAVPFLYWHGHEMIFGYTIAVIAGFLLTAVKNWTGVQTLNGIPLLLLFLVWVAGRILFFSANAEMLVLIAVVDSLFLAGLSVAVLIPVIKARQWKQMGIISKLLLLFASNLIFYAGTLGMVEDGMRIGLYSGVYLIVALIFTMGRRVIPFFIENGVGYPVQLKNRQWLDVSSLVLFLLFWMVDILRPDSLPVAVLSFMLLLLHTLRLAGWHTPGIWQRPLLWVLYLGYACLVAGFALKLAVFVAGISPSLPLHAFAYGGIGLMSLGMMSRVILGHTGRNVLEPPPVLFWVFGILLLGTVLRVLLPMIDPEHHLFWIGSSQVLWIAAFSFFLVLYLPMLVQARVDGRPE